MSSTTLMSGKRVFIGGGMTLFDDVASAISRLVAVKVVVCLISACGQRSLISVMRVKPVIDVAGKVGRAMEPRACSNKHPAHKPIRPIVAVGCAIVWGIREVPVGAHGRHSNVDGNLG